MERVLYNDNKQSGSQTNIQVDINLDELIALHMPSRATINPQTFKQNASTSEFPKETNKSTYKQPIGQSPVS